MKTGLMTLPDLWLSEHPEGSVILDPSNGQIFEFNQVGHRIWLGLLTGLTIDEIAEGIAEALLVERHQAQHDARLFLGQLQCCGLLGRRIYKQ